MTLEEAYEKRRQEVLSLKRQLNKAEKIIGELTAGTYVDSEKAEHLRTINRPSQCHPADYKLPLPSDCLGLNLGANTVPFKVTDSFPSKTRNLKGVRHTYM